MIEFRDTKFLRKNHTAIHAFGLGFIQIKLTQNHRIHLYSSTIRQTQELEEIHDHRYDFTSTILQGQLTNSTFFVTPNVNGNFSLSEVTCKPGLNGKHLCDCDVTSEESSLLTTGYQYELLAGTFHRVSATDGTITFLTKSTPNKEFARVVHSKGQTLVCPFSANVFSENELWEIYESAISKDI